VVGRTPDLDDPTYRGLLDGFDGARMRKERLARLHTAMDRHDLAAIIAFEYANTRYLSDLRPLWAPNFLVRQAAIVARDRDRVILFVHQDDTPHRRSVMPWIEPSDVREFPTGLANFGAPADAMRPLIAALDELDIPSDGRVATDIGTVSSLGNLASALGARPLVDAAACMRDVRAVKNEDELRLMRFASAVSALTMERAIAAIAPGVRECEVLAEAMSVLYRFGAEVPQCNLIVCSGPNTMPMQRYAGDRRIEPGDLVMLDLGGCFHGMFSELARTTVCGEPNPTQRAIYRSALDIHEATIAAMRPGATQADIQAAAAGPYEASPFHGRMQRMVIAHGIGVGYAEAPFVAPPGTPAPAGPSLEVGVTLAVVPTLLVPDVPGGGGVRIEDVLAVGPNGPERLTRHPYDDALLQ
jgi:Xaa-Pro aminopeptidase